MITTEAKKSKITLRPELTLEPQLNELFNRWSKLKGFGERTKEKRKQEDLVTLSAFVICSHVQTKKPLKLQEIKWEIPEVHTEVDDQFKEEFISRLRECIETHFQHMNIKEGTVFENSSRK